MPTEALHQPALVWLVNLRTPTRGFSAAGAPARNAATTRIAITVNRTIFFTGPPSMPAHPGADILKTI